MVPNLLLYPHRPRSQLHGSDCRGVHLAVLTHSWSVGQINTSDMYQLDQELVCQRWLRHCHRRSYPRSPHATYLD